MFNLSRLPFSFLEFCSFNKCIPEYYLYFVVAEISGETPICCQYLVGNCSQCCGYIHSSQKLPYVWQLLLYGTWVNVDEIEDIEKCFSDMCDYSDMFQMVRFLLFDISTCK